MARRAVDPQQAFPDLEHQVLERWRERDVFQESMRRRAGAEPWVFYEGPPTANGRPGRRTTSSRASSRTSSPASRRCAATSSSARAAGTRHGLPVEIAVEKELGISSKAEIEAYGIAEFNQKCRESVFTFLEDWNALTERIGFWVDLDDAYRTLDPTYIESVWWALRQIADKGLLYEGHKVVPYCPRCGTALSSHEVALGYEDVVDPSVYVRLPVIEDGGPLQAGDELLVWTTTPWTLVSNAAVAATPTSPTCAPGAAARRVSCSPRRSSSACWAARASRSSTASRARRSRASATSRRSATSPAASTGSAATASCSATS